MLEYLHSLIFARLAPSSTRVKLAFVGSVPQESSGCSEDSNEIQGLIGMA
jgi:hypothetical protein